MFVMDYNIFRAIQDGGTEDHALQGSQSSMFPFRHLFIKRNYDIGMSLHGNTSKKPMERLSCKI